MKLDTKTLTYAGIGIAVLVIGYMLYKKQGNKEEPTTDEKKSDVEEDVVEEIKTTEQPTKQKSDSLKTPIDASQPSSAKNSIGSQNKGTSDSLFKKYGITERDFRKMKAKKREIAEKYKGKRLSSEMPKIKELRIYALKDNISYEAFKKAEDGKLDERMRRTADANFMDFDGFPDVQANIM